MKIICNYLFSLLLCTTTILAYSFKKETISTTPEVIAPKSKKKVLVVVTSNDKLKDGHPAGYYLPEVIDFYKTLNDSGFVMDFASPKGGLAPMYDRTYFLNDPSTKVFLNQSGI